MPKIKPYQRSKLGMYLDERGYTLKEFAELVYDKTGYFIAITNLSNYVTGYKEIRHLDIARNFAKALDIDVKDLL
jgi:hypothetical protein